MESFFAGELTNPLSDYQFGICGFAIHISLHIGFATSTWQSKIGKSQIANRLDILK